jgi:hypothetical protein
MALRTVRLGPDAEQALRHIVRTTGLTVSGALNRGLLVLNENVARYRVETPYDVYARLDLGPGGDAIVPSTDVKKGVRAAIARKVGRKR